MKASQKLNHLWFNGQVESEVQFWLMDSVDSYREINETHCRFVGARMEDLLSQGLNSISDPDIRNQLMKLYDKIFEYPRVSTRELHFKVSEQAIRVTTVPVQLDQEHPAIFFIAQRIIYGSSRPTPSVPISDEILWASLSGMGAGLWHWNIPSGETVFDQKWAEMLGFTLAELAPVSIKTWEDLTHPDDLRQAEKLLNKHFDSQSPIYDVKLRMRHKQGHWVWIHDRGKVYKRSSDGKPLLMAGTHVDISERMQLTDLVQRQGELQQLASEFSVKLAQCSLLEMDRTIEAGLGQIGKFLNTDRVYIFRLDQTKKTLYNSHEWVAEGVAAEKDNLQDLPFDAFPWWMNRILNDQTIYIADTDKISDDQKDLKEILLMQSIKSLVVVPIEGRNGMIGFWGLDFVKDYWSFDEFTHQVLKYVSSLMSGALESQADQIQIMDLLEQERMTFQRVTDETESLILTTDLNQNIQYGNKALTESYGYTVEELSGKHPRDILTSPCKKHQPSGSVKNELERNGKWKGIFLNASKNRQLIIESATISPRHDSSGEITGFIKIAENITSGQKHQDWLTVLNHTHNASIRTLKEPGKLDDIMMEMVAVVDTLMVPQVMVLLPHIELEMPIFHPVSNHPILQRQLQENKDSFFQVNNLEIENAEKQQRVYNLGEHGDAHPLKKLGLLESHFAADEGELILGRIGTDRKSYGIIAMLHTQPVKFYDKSDLDNLSLQGKTIGQILNELEISKFIMAQNRQQQISQLASGLAHEVRNPLAVISIGMEVLEKKLDMQDTRVQKVFNNIDNSLTRANHIVENLMRLGTPEELETEVTSLDLSSVIEEAIALTTYHLRDHNIVLRNHCPPSLLVFGVKESLLKVFVNVLLNSIQAQEEGGEVDIFMEREKSGFILIQIRDRGPGIPEEDLPRIVKPFFSTKKNKHGNGMGLYICTETMDRLGGSFKIYNNAEEGVTVEIGIKEIIRN